MSSTLSDWTESHRRRSYTTTTRWSGLAFDDWFQALSPGDSKEEGIPAWFTDADGHDEADMSLTGPLALTWPLIRLLEIVGIGQLLSQVLSVCGFWGELFTMVECGGIEALAQKLGRDICKFDLCTCVAWTTETSWAGLLSFLPGN
jgi:hypothetical protein